MNRRSIFKRLVGALVGGSVAAQEKPIYRPLYRLRFSDAGWVQVFPKSNPALWNGPFISAARFEIPRYKTPRP